MLAAITGCAPKPVAPKVAELHFPVAVLFSTSSSVLYENAADLGVMHVNLVNGSTDAPTLIDSDFNLYTMENLRSTHGGLWLMAHPSDNTEVAFELKATSKSRMQAALAAMRVQLDKQTWRTDLEEKRSTLSAQKTLAGMIDTLHDAEK